MVSPAGHGARVGSHVQHGHVQLAPAGRDAAAPGRSYKREQEGPREVERLLTAWQGAHCFLQKKPPRAFQLGLFHSKGLCYKAVWEKERINAPKAAVKSTLQSSCFLCYLILILIEIFPAVLPGVLGSLHGLLPGQQRSAPAHAGGAGPSRPRSAHAAPPDVPPTPALRLLNASKLPAPSGILNIK